MSESSTDPRGAEAGCDSSQMSEPRFRPGQRVSWLYTARQGYCPECRVAGVVVAVGPKRVVIEVARKHTLGVIVRQRKFVKPERLSPRVKPCRELGES
jgi:hypothetical protein